MVLRGKMTRCLRVFSGVCGAVGAISLVASGYVAATQPFKDYPAFTSVGDKLIGQYTYFTVWSGIVGTITLFLYSGRLLSNTSVWARTLRTLSCMMLLVTGLVYQFVLSGRSHHEGLRIFTNFAQHQMLPIVVPLIWLLSVRMRSKFDVSWKTLGLTLVIPLIWTVMTFIRGVTTGGYYPYFFMNVGELGYFAAIRNTAAVYVLFFILMGVMAGVERLIRRVK